MMRFACISWIGFIAEIKSFLAFVVWSNHNRCRSSEISSDKLCTKRKTGVVPERRTYRKMQSFSESKGKQTSDFGGLRGGFLRAVKLFALLSILINSVAGEIGESFISTHHTTLF